MKKLVNRYDLALVLTKGYPNYGKQMFVYCCALVKRVLLHDVRKTHLKAFESVSPNLKGNDHLWG